MTDDVARSRLLRGADEPAPPMRTLRAGPVTALLDGCDLRYVRIGRTELARRIYAASRKKAARPALMDKKRPTKQRTQNK